MSGGGEGSRPNHQAVGASAWHRWAVAERLADELGAAGAEDAAEEATSGAGSAAVCAPPTCRDAAGRRWLNQGARQPVLVELMPLPATPVSERRYVVRLGDLRLELGDDFDPRTLLRLLEVVRAC